MTSQGRLARFDPPQGPPRSQHTQERVVPTKGYTDLPDIQAGPTSVVSARNAWLWANRITPRPSLVNIGNVLGDVPVGAFTYFAVDGTAYPMAFSKQTAAYYSAGTWTALTYVSGTSNNPPTGGQNDFIFGTSTYLPRADTNLAVWSNGVDPQFVWGGPSSGTAYSTGSQTYISKDVAVSNNRLLSWNVGYLSSTSQLVQRIAWSAAGNPEDTTGVDAGYVDLLDMRGAGTRVFTLAGQVIVTTGQEIWSGTFIGPPFVYQFTPLSRAQGVPYPKAAILTPEGVFWLGNDFMVYNVPPWYWYSKIDPVGIAIQRTLHRDCPDPSTAFFGYHADAKMLSLYYSDTAGQFPNRALTYNTLMQQWMPQQFAQNLVVGFSAQATSSATTWGALTGPLTGNVLTYSQLLGGNTTGPQEAVISSAGTAYTFDGSRTITSDDGATKNIEVTFGPFFTGLPTELKFFNELRVDVQSNTTSSLSLAISPDLGSTFPTEVSFTASVGSVTSQYRQKVTGVSGVNCTVRLRGSDGDWNTNALTVVARIGPEAI